MIGDKGGSQANDGAFPNNEIQRRSLLVVDKFFCPRITRMDANDFLIKAIRVYSRHSRALK
jgi:hypothetical protein